MLWWTPNSFYPAVWFLFSWYIFLVFSGFQRIRDRTGHLSSIFKLWSISMPPLFVLCFHCQIFCAYVSLVSQSDCYVSLWLPAASDEKFHTKTIKNCRNPVWNETFYFRIQRQVKVHKPKPLFSIWSLCSFFQFSRKQDVMSSNAFLSLLKIPLTSWSKIILAFAAIHFSPNK